MVSGASETGLWSSKPGPSQGRVTSGTRVDHRRTRGVGKAQMVAQGPDSKRQSVVEVGSEWWWVQHITLAPRLGQGRGRKASRGQLAEQNKNSPPGPPPGEGVVGYRHLLKSSDPRLRVRPSQGRRRTLALHRLGRGGGGPRRSLRPAPCCGHCEGCCCGRAGAEGGGRRRAPSATSRAEGLQPAVGGLLDSSGPPGQDDETPPSASVRRRTVGQSPPSLRRIGPAWEIGESRKRCLSDSLISAKVSHRWRSWTTNVDIVWPRARAVDFSSPLARVRRCGAVPANHLGQHHPRAGCFKRLAWWTCRRAMACRAKRPVQQHRKPWPLERTRTYSALGGRRGLPLQRQRPAGKAAWQWRARPGGTPPTLGLSAVECGEDGGGH